jgi:hypothetical protein
MATCLLVAAFSGMYLTAVDLSTQICLCLPMFHISSLMKPFDNNSSAEEVAVDVILHHILFGNMELIASIWYPAQNLRHLMIDIEMQRYCKSVNALSEILLQNDEHMFKTQLAQDLLLTSSMNYFGGKTNDNGEQQQTRTNKFLYPKCTTLSIAVSGCGEPFAVSLVQTLCTYAGGLGLTLLSISSLES